MNNYVAIVFDNYAEASYARRKLEEMNRVGDFTVHAAAIVRRDAAGRYEVVDQLHVPGLRTVIGAAVGTLVSTLLAGPAAIGLGTYGGAVSGLVGDVVKAGERDEALIEVEAGLHAGEAAIVAELTETDPSRLDLAMCELGARTYRRSAGDLRAKFFDT